MFGWLKKAAVASAGVVLPLAGGAVGAYLGGPIGARIGAAVGGSLAHWAQTGKLDGSTVVAGVASSFGARMGGGIARSRLGFLGGAQGRAAARAGQNARRHYNLPANAPTPLLRGGRLGATLRGQAQAARRSERTNLARNRPDSWRNHLNPGANGWRWSLQNNNLRRSGLGYGGAAGVGAVGGYYASKPLNNFLFGDAPRKQREVPGGKGPGNGGGPGNAGKYVGGYVTSAKNGDFTQYTNPDNTKGFLWQPDGLSPGLKTLYSKDTGAAAAVTI